MPFSLHERWGGIAISGLACALYLATLSRDYAADGILFATAVESGSLQALVDPYHVLVQPVAWGFYRLCQLAGWSGGALLPLQVLNGLGGALCVGLLYAIARRLARSVRVALAVAGAFAVSCGAWLFSTDAEFVTPALAVKLGLLWGLLAASPERAKRPGYAVLLGLGASLAIFTYLTSAFLILVALVGFLLIEFPWRVRLWQVLIFVVVVLLALVPTYLLLMRAVFGIRDLPGLLALFSGGSAYGQFSWRSLLHGAYAFLRTLGGWPGLGLNDSTAAHLARAGWGERIAFAAYYALLLALVAVPLLAVWRRRRVLWRTHRQALAMMGVWAFLYAAFAVWWVPGDMTFWMPVATIWWLLLALVAGSAVEASEGKEEIAASPGVEIGSHAKTQRRKAAKTWRLGGFARGFLAFILGLAVLLFVVNGFGIVFPNRDPARNWEYQVALSLTERTAPGDLVLVDGVNRLPLYAPYFAHRRALPVAGLLQGEAARTWLEETIAQARAEDGRVFLVAAGPGKSTEVSLDAIPAWEVAGVQVLEVLP